MPPRRARPSWRGSPPATIIVGDLDLFLGDALRYAGTLTRSAVPTALHIYPGAYHGFVSFAQGAAVSKTAFAVFMEAIASRLAVSPTNGTDRGSSAGRS